MNIIKILAASLVPNFKSGYLEFRDKSLGLPLKTRVSDTISVLSSLGFFLFFAVLAALVFLVISPGKDALLIVVEDVNTYHFLTVLSLICGIFIWSICAEFGIRYAIYVTDNSGKSLSMERVLFRKTLQKIIAGSCLIIPSLTVILSFIIMLFTQESIQQNNMWVSLLIILFLIYWLLCILTHLYIQSFEDKKAGRQRRKWFLSSQYLPSLELDWANRIYGIYNDFVFMLPKPENFLGAEKQKLETFSDAFEKTPQSKESNFPQKSESISTGVIVPEDFDFIKFDDGGSNDSESFRWIYFIPNSFYTVLHKQLKWVVWPSIIVILLISIIPADKDILENLGAPGLLCGAFACWIGVYTGVLYVDYALLRKSWFSLRIFIFFIFIFSSYYNHDHPVRVMQSDKDTTRMAFKDHFKSWFANYKHFMDSDSVRDRKETVYPVVFICAEGGALRTGAYTALFLDQLKDSLAEYNIDFKRSVYAMSGVSGGSLGLGYFNAANYINDPSDFKKDFKKDSTAAEAFFLHDFLSPVIGKMFYSDLLSLFIPFHFDRFDRAVALEESWEYAYNKVLNKKAKNVKNTFAHSFLSTCNRPGKTLPLLLFNTTEVETGNQCWVTNVVPGDIIFAQQRDLLGSKIDNDVRYSTAINFSSRFPLFSPGGMLAEKNSCRDYKLHYVDGGYYENTGAGSMLELLDQIKQDPISKSIYPVVIYLRFSDDPATQNQDINFGNEIAEIVSGIYDTRNGRTYMAVKQLNQLATHFQDSDSTGTYIDEPLGKNQRQVPMNWALSLQSLKYVKTDVEKKLSNKHGILPMITHCKYKFPNLK